MREAGLDVEEIIGMQYNPSARSIPRPRHRRQLPDAHDPEWLTPSSSTSTAHLADTAPDLAGASTGCSASTARAHAVRVAAPQVSHGVRGMLGVGFWPDARRCRIRATGRALSRALYDTLCVETRLFDGMEPLLDSLDDTAYPGGAVTNKPERPTQSSPRSVSADAASASWVALLPGPTPSSDPLLASPAPVLTRRRADRCLYVGDDIRDIHAGRAAGMKTWPSLYGYLGMDAHRRPGKAGRNHRPPRQHPPAWKNR